MEIQLSAKRREYLKKLKDLNHPLSKHLRYGYPKLETSLSIIAGGKYESHGFPYFFLDYNYQQKSWGVVFRNPKNFSNPGLQESTPTKAVHKMIDFLTERIINNKSL